jgi:phosphonopyruvate decarboxylase
MKASVIAAEIHRVAPAPHVGVPDSLLKDYLVEVERLTGHPPRVAPNEGAAVAYAIGYFLATGAPAIVFLQNSGLGNALNPLLSLAHERVYGIPMLVLVGWRGAPNTDDEPQHLAQGQATKDLIVSAGFPLLEMDSETSTNDLTNFLECNVPRPGPTFLLVRPDAAISSEHHSHIPRSDSATGMDAEEAIRGVLRRASQTSAILATTGYTARQVEYLYQREFTSLRRPFLSIGGMGHASAIALGLAASSKSTTCPWSVICIDGDGSTLMHLGTMAWIAATRPNGFLHVILTNGRHESVGGQPTSSPNLDFAAVARACGCENVVTVDHLHNLEIALDRAAEIGGHATVVIHTRLRGSTAPPRPSATPREMLADFSETRTAN